MPVASGFSLSAPPESLKARSAGPLRPSGRRIGPTQTAVPRLVPPSAARKIGKLGPGTAGRGSAGASFTRSGRLGPAKAAGRSRKTVAASARPVLMPGALVWTAPDSAEDRLPQLSHSCIHCVLPAASGNPESDRPKCPAGCASPKDCSDFAGSRLRDPAFFLARCSVRRTERADRPMSHPSRPKRKGRRTICRLPVEFPGTQFRRADRIKPRAACAESRAHAPWCIM